MRVVVDYDLCESNALCMAAAPEVWPRASRCGIWTVHQVLAHLVVLAEGTVASVMGGTFRASPLSPNKGIERVAVRTAASVSPAELLPRLRAARDGRFVVPGLPPTVALGEVLVHRSDVTDAAGLPPLAADERSSAKRTRSSATADQTAAASTGFSPRW